MSEKLPIERDIVAKEEWLFHFFQFTRLTIDREIAKQKLESVKKDETDSWLARFKKGTKNFFGSYEDKVNQSENSLSAFREKNPKYYDEQTAKQYVSELFDNQSNDLSRLLMATSIIMDNEYSYIYGKEGLMASSSVLFGNKSEILDIKDKLEKNYRAINAKGLTTLQKAALVGVAVVALAAVVTMPVLMGAGAKASAAATTAALAASGFGDMQIGLATITASSLLLGAALMGIAYGGMKLYNDNELKKEFRGLTPEKSAFYLAFQCTYIERIRGKMSKEEFNNVFESMLENLNVIKGDLDHAYFIERDSTEDNKLKIKSFHNFEDRLIKILA